MLVKVACQESYASRDDRNQNAPIGLLWATNLFAMGEDLELLLL
jgi:hypothetical protein